MPTILRWGPYRAFFYSNEGGEPPHIHVRSGDFEAKFWLHDLSVDMFPEDGCLRVYGVGEDGVTAFTEYGIECLRQIIADERAAGDAPPQVKPTE